MVYHQCVALHIIKPQERYTPARDEIQPEGLMIYTLLRAVMIYQACGLDKKIDKLTLVDFLAGVAVIKQSQATAQVSGRKSVFIAKQDKASAKSK